MALFRQAPVFTSCLLTGQLATLGILAREVVRQGLSLKEISTRRHLFTLIVSLATHREAEEETKVKPHRFLLLSILAIGALAWAQDHGHSREETTEALSIVSQTEKGLRAILAEVRRPVMIDLDPALQVSDMLEPVKDVRSLQMLAIGMKRSMREADGCFVFPRTGLYDEAARGWAWTPLSQFLKSLSPEARTKLMEGGLSLNELPERDQIPVIKALALTANSAMDMNENWGSVKLQLSLSTDYACFDETGKKIWNGSIQGKEKPRFYFEDTGDRPGEKVSILPIAPPKDGLDFGEGRVCTILELIHEAAAKLSLHITVDQRLYSSLVFVKGSFDKKHFLESLEIIAETKPLSSADGLASARKKFLQDLTTDLEWLRRHECEGVDATLSSMMTKEGMFPGSVLTGNDFIMGELNRNHIDPNKVRVSFVPRMLIMVNIPGTRPMSPGSANQMTKSYGYAFPP